MSGIAPVQKARGAARKRGCTMWIYSNAGLPRSEWIALPRAMRGFVITDVEPAEWIYRVEPDETVVRRCDVVAP